LIRFKSESPFPLKFRRVAFL